MNAIFREDAAVQKCSDTITILKSAGPRMTKLFRSDGSVEGYENAAQFSIGELPVSSIRELSAILSKAADKPRCCAIRGTFIGIAAAQDILPPEKPGLYLRRLELYSDKPHYWVCFDVDAWASLLYDPVREPAAAIEEFIAAALPAAFHGVSFFWQLSSSAGQKPGILKAHIWFWLSRPYSCRELRAWAKAGSVPVDKALFNTIQAHYTAAPVFEAGRVDPVPVRHGFQQGLLGDEVPFEIPEHVLALAGEAQPGGGGDIDMPDPREKPGVIGAVCRAWTITDVINEILPDEFQFAAGSNRRVTWVNGRGAAEGCFVTDDDLHLGNKHDSDPLDNRLTNAFDLIRWYKFGHLDTDLDLVTDVTSRPSYRAMVAWAEDQDEVKAELHEEAKSSLEERDRLAALIVGATTELALRHEVVPELQKSDLEKVDREHLAQLLKNRWQALAGTPMAIKDARDMVARRHEEGEREAHGGAAPDWMRPWVYVTDCDKFLNLDSKARLTRQGFDAAHNRHMSAWMDDEGRVPNASQFAIDTWEVPIANHTAYLPGAEKVFEMGGLVWANTYSADTAPALVPAFIADEQRAIDRMLAHAEAMIPDTETRDLFLDWVAFQVQKPGVKVRFAPYLHGCPGDGKTFWFELLALMLGFGNAKMVNASTLGGDFTGWATGAQVIVLEEVKLHGHNAWDVVNKLKPYITNNHVEIHAKGKDPYNQPNVSNYLMFSNYLDGCPVDEDDRRNWIISSAVTRAQVQTKAWEQHCSELFDLCRAAAGALRTWFMQRQIGQGFNPNGRAPMTDAKRLAIELSKSDLRVAAEDVIESGARGVTREVISSAHLVRAVEEKHGEKVHTSGVKKLITQLGYAMVGRKRWDGDMRRLWVRQDLCPMGAQRAVEILESAGFNGDEFLN